jgi:predicted secreted protein
MSEKQRLLKNVKNKVFSLVIVVLFLYAPQIWASDTASFVDLGFSTDGRKYMFAQYGVQSETLFPWSDLFVVDVSQNNFVGGGRVSFVHDCPVIAGQDGSGAFHRLLSRNAALAERYAVNYLNQGRTLYIAMGPHNSAVLSGETIEFRDFTTNAQYKAQLVPSVVGSGTNLSSSFYISFEQTGRDGARKTFTVGNPQIKRPLINSYRIRRAIVAPNDGSVIFVIEMRRQTSEGFAIRYMVEALRM